jgi:hypothetical protein
LVKWLHLQINLRILKSILNSSRNIKHQTQLTEILVSMPRSLNNSKLVSLVELMHLLQFLIVLFRSRTKVSNREQETSQLQEEHRLESIWTFHLIWDNRIYIFGTVVSWLLTIDPKNVDFNHIQKLRILNRNISQFLKLQHQSSIK